MHRVFQWRKVSRKASLIKDQINLFQSWPKTIFKSAATRNSVLSAWKEHFREQLAWCGEGWRDGGSAAVTPQNTREEFPRPFVLTLDWSGQWVVQPQPGTRIQCSSISAHEFKWKWCPDCLYLHNAGFSLYTWWLPPTRNSVGRWSAAGVGVNYHGNKFPYRSAPAHSAHLAGDFINLRQWVVEEEFRVQLSLFQQ